MALFLCHDCYSWVEPFSEHCPECWQVVDPSRPDPSLEQLERDFGRIVLRVGEIRINRRMLPDRGTLFATTNGLIFLPDQVERVIDDVETAYPTESILWAMAGLVWSPLHLVSLWKHRSRPRRKGVVRVFRPHFLTERDSHRLPGMLMQNPGVFFIPRRLIRSATRRFDRWRIDRYHATTVKLRPRTDGARFHDRFAELLACSNWNHFSSVAAVGAEQSF
ncbi:MAG: hypothetical protein AB7O26_03475 [Planctomycetaceae bacterium]